MPNLPPVTSEPMSDPRALLADPDVGKIGHNIKYDMIVLERAGAPRGHRLRHVSASLRSTGKRAHSLDVLGLERLERKLISYSDVRQRPGTDPVLGGFSRWCYRVRG